MAIVPLLVNLARELDAEYTPRPLATEWDDLLLDDDFGFGIHPMDIFRPALPRATTTSLMLQPRRRYSPYQVAKRRSAKGGGAAATAGSLALPTVGKDGFQVCMDVSQFKPNELTVKTVDKQIVVEGNHEERPDEHGLIQRHFVRKYTLPQGYDPKDVVSTISSDGVLTVKAAPPPSKAIKQNERVVQIQQTGPAHLSVKAPEGQEGKEGQGQNGPGENMETK